MWFLYLHITQMRQGFPLRMRINFFTTDIFPRYNTLTFLWLPRQTCVYGSLWQRRTSLLSYLWSRLWDCSVKKISHGFMKYRSNCFHHFLLVFFWYYEKRKVSSMQLNHWASLCHMDIFFFLIPLFSLWKRCTKYIYCQNKQ